MDQDLRIAGHGGVQGFEIGLVLEIKDSVFFHAIQPGEIGRGSTPRLRTGGMKPVCHAERMRDLRRVRPNERDS